MKPKSYFEKFPETPIDVRPYDPALGGLAEAYLAFLRDLLSGFEVEIEQYGSVPLKIAGKGELEFALCPADGADWGAIVAVLTERFGEPVTVKSERVRFGDVFEGIPVEIDLKRGKAAIESRETMRLLSDPKVLREYEAMKLASAHSEREYMHNKKKFFARLMGEDVES